MFLLRLLSRLPFTIHYLISDFLFVVSYYLIRYRRRLVKTSLANSFPEKSTLELNEIEKEFYRNLCDYAVETLKLLTITKEELNKRMKYVGWDGPLGIYKEKNQSVILLASHTFNWEWLLVAGTLQLPLEIDFVYQPQNSEFFNKFSLAMRTRFGAHAISRSEVAKVNFKRRNMLRGISIVADQYPGHASDKKYITQFLNQETAFFYGAAQLAVTMKYPVVYASVIKVGRGRYENRFVRISEPPYSDGNEIVENYARAVEKQIHEQPSGWLWSHNRWKKRHLKATARITN